MNRQPITQETIYRFLEGRDPQEHIVNLEYYNNQSTIRVHIRNKDFKKVYQDYDFYPFLWATREACDRLLKGSGGDRKNFKAKLDKWGIKCIKLDTENVEGVPCDKMQNGYMFMFKATKPMSYGAFLKFFKECGNPVFSEQKENEPGTQSSKGQYLVVTPQEQYLIYTGKRFFKGYDDYNDILRMIFDLETGGLDAKKHRIEWVGIRMNRPILYHGELFNEFVKELQLTGETEEEKNKSELALIDSMIRVIYSFRPDVITAHNGEAFDWKFIIERCEQLGTSIEAVCAKYFNPKTLLNKIADYGFTIKDACDRVILDIDKFYQLCRQRNENPKEIRAEIFSIKTIRKDNRETVLKLGGEVEHFKKTIVPGVVITDSLHAVRRAQATDSNFKEGNLKYATKYLKMVKPNRVYIPGDKISQLTNDYEKHYAFNPQNGKWHVITDENPLTDGYEVVSGHYIVEQYLGDDLWECDKVEYALNSTDFMLAKIIPVPFSKCVTMGTAGQWKAIMLAWSYENNLAIPKPENTGAFTGGLSRLLRVGYVKDVIKLDYNSLYPSIILTWAISDDTDLMGAMLNMLEYVLTTREKHKGLKKAAGKIVDKYEKLKNEGVELTPEQQAEYDAASNDFKIEDNRQMSVKKLGNSFFGSYGSNNGSVFPWKSLKCAERTTCTGRMALRLMISHFHGLGYEPIVGDTDGFNFKLPKTYRYTEDNPYIGKGLSRETKEGKDYTGYEADVAEFNDMYMCDMHYHPKAVNKMGLGIDEVVSSTINFSRKNYADYFPEKPYPEDVKMVGNTIKSKKMPEYIAKFLDKGIRLLLQGKGKDFLEEYYDYVEKIYNYQIPLRDIASKGKIKKTIEEYVEDCKTLTKAGRPKSRQAWMELAINEGLSVDLGETLYYINIGKTKSQSDVKKVSTYYEDSEVEGEERVNVTAKIDKELKTYKAECKERGIKPMSKEEFIQTRFPKAYLEENIILYSVLLSRDMVESEKDFYCEEGKEYNAPKYIAQFNSRITPLLVCFSKDIRDKILITKPSDRPYFTEEEAELTSGEPNNPGDQDTYEQLMTMEDKEIRFWAKYPEFEIPYIKECGIDWEKTLADYNERQRIEKERGIDIIRGKYDEIINKLTDDDIDNLMDGTLPSGLESIVDIDYNTGNFVSKQYPEYVIGRISDFFEKTENVEETIEPEY